MKKVIVIGCPGSGKSVFSAALSQKTGLPLCHLDMLYWNPDRTTVSREVFDDRLNSVIESDQWIIDGNYGRTMEVRMMAADARPDLPWIEPADEPDEEFTIFVREYSERSRPRVLELLKKYSDRKIIVFHSRRESEEYLTSL